MDRSLFIRFVYACSEIQIEIVPEVVVFDKGGTAGVLVLALAAYDGDGPGPDAVLGIHHFMVDRYRKSDHGLLTVRIGGHRGFG